MILRWAAYRSPLSRAIEIKNEFITFSPSSPVCFSASRPEKFFKHSDYSLPH